MGWSGLQVAEEATLDLGQVAFTGKQFQDVRTALNRAKKSGITAEWISFPHAPLAIKDQIVAISEEWVADKGMPEMGFTLGGLDEIDDEQVRCLIAVDEDRTVRGVTSWLPVYRDGKFSWVDTRLHEATLRRIPSRDGVPHRLRCTEIGGGGGRRVPQSVRCTVGNNRR